MGPNFRYDCNRLAAFDHIESVEKMTSLFLQKVTDASETGKLRHLATLSMSNQYPADAVSAEEKRLLDAAQNGSRDAQERLLEPHRQKLEAFFARRVGDADEAGNLAQQTIVEALRQLPNFRGACPFSRWLWRIAGNVALQAFRCRSPYAPLQEEYEASATFEAPTVELTDWLQRMLKVAKCVCSQAELTVMLLYYQTGSMEETADLAEMKPATARSHFLRGRSALLAHLVRFEPEWVGGASTVRSIATDLHRSGGEQGLSDEEYHALSSGRHSTKHYRAACLKIARHFPNPVFTK